MEHEGSNLSYYHEIPDQELCAKWNYNCYDNDILRLSDIIPKIEAREENLTYPIYFHLHTYEVSIKIGI